MENHKYLIIQMFVGGISVCRRIVGADRRVGETMRTAGVDLTFRDALV